MPMPAVLRCTAVRLILHHPVPPISFFGRSVLFIPCHRPAVFGWSVLFYPHPSITPDCATLSPPPPAFHPPPPAPGARIQDPRPVRLPLLPPNPLQLTQRQVRRTPLDPHPRPLPLHQEIPPPARTDIDRQPVPRQRPAPLPAVQPPEHIHRR